MAKTAELPGLPSFAERAAEVAKILAGLSENWPTKDSSALARFNAIEQVYGHLHSLKGVSRILGASDAEAERLFSSCDELNRILQGTAGVPELTPDWLEFVFTTEKRAHFEQMTAAWLKSAGNTVPEHDSRLANLPQFPLAIGPTISKRFFLARQCGYRLGELSEACALPEYPAWITKVQRELPRGSEVIWLHGSPQVNVGGGTHGRAFAWLAVRPEACESLLREQKVIFPRASFEFRS